MNRFCYRCTFLLLAVAIVTCIATAQTSHTATSPDRYNASDRHQQPAFAMHSTAFIANRGQVGDTRGERRSDILYTVQAPGASLYFMKDRISYVFARLDSTGEKEDAGKTLSNHGDNHDEDNENPYRVSELYRMDMELVG